MNKNYNKLNLTITSLFKFVITINITFIIYVLWNTYYIFS